MKKVTYIYIFTLLFVKCTSYKNNNFSENLKNKDTVYVFNKKIKVPKNFIYKDHNPKYYWMMYTISTYWKEEKTDKNDDGYYYDNDYTHMFVYGVSKKSNYPEFDPTEMYGNGKILKKHKSFLNKNKHKIIDYKWLKKLTPPQVHKILKPYKTRKNKPTLFLIDKNEFKNDSIILKNVMYWTEVIQ